MNSSNWLRTAILVGFLYVGSAAKVEAVQGTDPFGVCEGKVTQYQPPTPPGGLMPPPRYPRLVCTPTTCAPGCAKMSVTTAFGTGEICICDYMGPQPFCCTIAFVDVGHEIPFGDCGGYCPAGTSCSTSLEVTHNEDGSTLYTRTAHCVGFY